MPAAGCVGVAYAWKLDSLIVPTGHGLDIYLVLDDLGNLGRAYPETDPERADLETVISDLITGEYNAPISVVAFNFAEQWAEDRKILHENSCAVSNLPVMNCRHRLRHSWIGT